MRADQRSTTIVVAMLTSRLWLRGTAASLSVRESTLKISVATGGLAVLLLGAALASWTWAQLQSGVPDAYRISILESCFGAACVTSTLVSCAMSASAPARSSIDVLLATLPISRRQIAIGTTLPLLALATAVSAALSSTSAAVTAKLARSTLEAVSQLSLLALLVALCCCLSLLVTRLVQPVVSRFLHLPDQYAFALSSALVMGSTLAAVVSDVLDVPTPPPVETLRAVLPHHTFARLAVGDRPLIDTILAATWVLLVVLGALLISQRRPSTADAGASRLLWRTHVPRTPRTGAAWVFLLEASRSPQALLTIVSPLGLVIVAVLVRQTALPSDVSTSMCRAALCSPFLIALFAVGRALTTRWWGTTLSANPLWWLWPTAAANGVLGVVLGLPAVGLAIVADLVAPADLALWVPRCAFTAAVALVAGTAIPFTEEQPLSGPVAATLAALVTACSFSIELITGQESAAGSAALTLGEAVILLLAYRTLSKRAVRALAT